MVTGTPRIISDGLVFHFDAANTKSYIGGGTNCVDLSATAVTGSLINGPTFSSERAGTIVFDGTNDYLQFPFSPILNDCAINIWFKATSTKSYQYLLTISNGINNTYNFNIDINDPDSFNARQTVWTYWNSGGDQASWIGKTGTYGDWQDSTWRNYTFVRNSLDTPIIKHYMNGVRVTTNLGTSGTQTTQFGNGSGYLLTIGNIFPGNISLMSIYNRAFTASEVLQSYEALRERFGV